MRSKELSVKIKSEEEMIRSARGPWDTQIADFFSLIAVISHFRDTLGDGVHGGDGVIVLVVNEGG